MDKCYKIPNDVRKICIQFHTIWNSNACKNWNHPSAKYGLKVEHVECTPIANLCYFQCLNDAVASLTAVLQYLNRFDIFIINEKAT